MAEYYYTQGGQRQGPIAQETLRGMIDRGELTATDYYWTQGMAEWALIGDGSLGAAASAQPAATPFETSPAPTDTTWSAPSSGESGTPFGGAAPAAGMGGAMGAMGGTIGAGAGVDTISVKDLANKLPKPLWLIILGVSLALAGLLNVISIWGIIVAWIPIWMAVLLFQANGALEKARRSGRRADLVTGVEKINTFFTIMGVMVIVYFVLIILLFTVFATVLSDFSF